MISCFKEGYEIGEPKKSQLKDWMKGFNQTTAQQYVRLLDTQENESVGRKEGRNDRKLSKRERRLLLSVGKEGW
jgi:hypothetical protein